MSTFAIIRNNTVVNIIIADSAEIAQSITGLDAVEYTAENPARLGDSYDFATNTFTTPQIEVVND